MTEDEKNRIGSWLNSPQSMLYLAREMLLSHGGRVYLQTPETNGFPANRFEGRLSGYIYALAYDRITSKKQFRISIEEIAPYTSTVELEALEKLQQKITEQSEKEIPLFDDGYVGLCEGMAIYINKEDLSLLYSEIDIDLNKNCDDEGIPSYAYHRAHLKAGRLLESDKSKEEVTHILINDGIARQGANMIIDRMIDVIKHQRKKRAVISIGKGILIFIAGLAITAISYHIAESNGGGRYILTWGAIAVGAIYILSGIKNFIKALFYKK